MLRFGKIFGGVGRGPAVALGAGTAAAPSKSNCRAQTTQHRATLGRKTDQDVPLTALALKQTGETDQDWLVADVHNDNVIFGPGEISEVINNVMGISSRDANRSDVAIHEVEGDQTDSDAESIGADANEFMAAAGLEVSRVHDDRDTFITALNNMVNRPDVQSVVLRALLEDENVQALLHDRNLVGRDAAPLLPPAAVAGLAQISEEVEERGQEEHPLKKIAEAVAAKLLNVGERIKDTAANVLLSLGYQIYALLGRPFAKAAAETQDANARPDWVPKMLMTLGCAVITLLFFKRLRIVAL